MSLEHEIITPAIATAVRDVAIHLGSGAIATATAVGVQVPVSNKINFPLTAIVGGVAAIAGPHLLGPEASAYLHSQTIPGVALGTIGIAAAGAISGSYLLDKMINDHTGNETSFIGKVMGFAGGAAVGPAIYLAIEAAGYFR